jgi:hypothetical protein
MSASRQPMVYQDPTISTISQQSQSIRRRGRGIFKYSFSSTSSSSINLIPIHGFNTPNFLSCNSPLQVGIEATSASQSSSRIQGEQSTRPVEILEEPVCDGNVWVVLEEERENFKRATEKLTRPEDTAELLRKVDINPTSDSIEHCKRTVARWRFDFDNWWEQRARSSD